MAMGCRRKVQTRTAPRAIDWLRRSIETEERPATGKACNRRWKQWKVTQRRRLHTLPDVGGHCLGGGKMTEEKSGERNSQVRRNRCFTCECWVCLRACRGEDQRSKNAAASRSKERRSAATPKAALSSAVPCSTPKQPPPTAAGMPWPRVQRKALRVVCCAPSLSANREAATASHGGRWWKPGRDENAPLFPQAMEHESGRNWMT